LQAKFNFISFFSLLTLVLIVENSLAQKLNINDDVNYKTFSIKEGFKVNEVDAMLFDDEGWLWISGRSLVPIKNQINTRKLILQRYDGSTFHDVELPDLPDIPFN
jgi:beta-xylosidase